MDSCVCVCVCYVDLRVVNGRVQSVAEILIPSARTYMYARYNWFMFNIIAFGFLELVRQRLKPKSNVIDGGHLLIPPSSCNVYVTAVPDEDV